MPMRRRLSSGFSGLQQPGAAGEGVGQQHQQHQLQGSGSLVFEVDEGSDIDFDLPPIPHYGSAGGVQELRDVTNPGDSHRTVGRLYHDNTHKDLFPFDSEEELHFDELRDFRSPRSRKKLSARISVTFVQWLGVFCTCLAVSMLVFFLLALRADNLNKKFAHDNKSGAPPTSSAPAGGAIESMLSPQAKHALQMKAAKDKLLQPAEKKTNKTYPAPPPRAIPLADSVKDEAKRNQEELKRKREKQAAADRAAVKTAPSTPSAKVNEMMKRRYEKLIQYISSAGGGSVAVTKNLPQLTHQPTVGGGRSLDPFNAPQPDLPLASAKSSESQSQDVKQAANKAPVIDFGWRFDNPADVSKAFGSEMDHVLDLCRGRRAVVKHPNKTGQHDGDDGIKEEFVMYTLNSAAQYAYPCWQAFENVFLNELDPGEDARHDLSFVRPSDKNKKWKTMRKKLKFGDFQSLYFMWPDGNAAPTAPGAEALPDGFPLPKGIAIKAGSTDQVEIMKGLAAMLDEVVGSDALVFITVQVGYENEQLANGATETVEVQTLVFYAMVGKNDIQPIAGYHQGLQEHTAGDEKTGAEEKAYPPARKSGSGVWKVQTARDARGHEVCPGSMVQIFDTLAEMRHKIWPQLDIILILDASWSYASGEHQEDPFDNPHRNEWLKHSDMMRHLLTKLGDASLTPEKKLQIRAQILEGVKTPGRNCYLAPYLTGRTDYQQLTRMVGFTNHAITEWKGMQYPSMSVPGLFPGINYYIFELPEVVPSPRTLPTTTTATTASTAPASAPEPFAYRGPHSANNWNVRVLNKKGQWADYLDADPEAVLNDSKNIPVVPDLNPRRPHRNIPNWVKQEALMTRQAGELHEQSLDHYMNNRMTMDDVQRGGGPGTFGPMGGRGNDDRILDTMGEEPAQPFYRDDDSRRYMEDAHDQVDPRREGAFDDPKYRGNYGLDNEFDEVGLQPRRDWDTNAPFFDEDEANRQDRGAMRRRTGPRQDLEFEEDDYGEHNLGEARGRGGDPDDAWLYGARDGHVLAEDSHARQRDSDMLYNDDMLLNDLHGGRNTNPDPYGNGAARYFDDNHINDVQEEHDDGRRRNGLPTTSGAGQAPGGPRQERQRGQQRASPSRSNDRLSPQSQELG